MIGPPATIRGIVLTKGAGVGPGAAGGGTSPGAGICTGTGKGA